MAAGTVKFCGTDTVPKLAAPEVEPSPPPPPPPQAINPKRRLNKLRLRNNINYLIDQKIYF
jgi:hypothetical protein